MLCIVKNCICHLIASASKKCTIFIQEVIHKVCFATQNNIYFCYVICLCYCFESFKISCSGTRLLGVMYLWNEHNSCVDLQTWLVFLTELDLAWVLLSNVFYLCFTFSPGNHWASLCLKDINSTYWSRFQPKERKDMQWKEKTEENYFPRFPKYTHIYRRKFSFV